MLKMLPKLHLSLLAAVTFSVGAFADTVVLNSGEKLEGKITKETDAEVTIETSAGGILDERTIKRSEVKSVDKASPDEAPWQAVRGLKLGDNSMPVTQYDAHLGPLKSFLTQFPESKHKPEVEKTIAEFEAEKQRVAGGERKLSGNWLSKEEVQRESYQINGAITLNFLRDQAGRGDLVGALNTFDTLEKQYPGSRSYVDAVDYVKRLLPTLKQQAEARVARFPTETAEREKAVQLARTAEKAQLQAEFEREKQTNTAALEQAKKQGRKWPPFLPRSEEALQQIVQLATEETQRLAAIDVTKQRESVRLAEQAKAALAKKDVTTAEESLKKAQDLWPENEVLARIDKELTSAREVASTDSAAATADTTSSETNPDKPPTSADGSGDAASADDTESRSPVMRIAIGVLILGVLYAAWKAFSNSRNKENEGTH